MSIAQAETAAAVAGDAHLVLVVGPAGTGKTTALKPAIDQLHAEGRAVFGVAPSAVAADVLATETGTTADTLDKLLFEHSADRPPAHTYNLPRGATVIVDEAGMLPTDNLHRLANLADDKAWRVVLVGDPLQFSAVGRGGMFEYLADTCGAIELDRVHRFSNDWERAASLRLRRGDPTVADVYDQHGRLHGGTTTRMHRDALDAWWHARHRGETVLLAAPTNDTVTVLNQAAQRRRLHAGELDQRRHLPVGNQRLYVGDEIVTRRNDRHLLTDQQCIVRNRDHWIITTLHRNGDVTASGTSGTVRLPTDYVQAHVELGYAQTSHAAQGRTVDRSILVLDAPTDVRGIYVPMTRGRHHNDVYITTTGEHTALDVFAESIARNWIDLPAIARQAELAGTERPRPGTLPAHELRALFDQRADITDTLARLDDDLHQLPNTIQSIQKYLASEREKQERRRTWLAEATTTLETYDRPLRRRRHETEISKARRSIEHLPDEIARYDTKIANTADYIAGLEEDLETAKRLYERRPRLESKLTDIDARLTDDRRIRTRQLRHDPPTRITGTIGNRPKKPEAIRTWDAALGYLDQHQSAHNVTAGLGNARRPDVTRGFLHSRALTARIAREPIEIRNREQAITRSPVMRIR